jgi:hypothetical protein
VGTSVESTRAVLSAAKVLVAGRGTRGPARFWRNCRQRPSGIVPYAMLSRVGMVVLKPLKESVLCSDQVPP